MSKKIAVSGTGYVGLSNALLLAQHNEVAALDIITDKEEILQNRIPPIEDEGIQKVQNSGADIVIYEPLLDEEVFEGFKVIKDLGKFKSLSDEIVANRLSDEIMDVKEKVYTRDIFNSDQ